MKRKIEETNVFEESDYPTLKAFNDQLLDETSPLGKIISVKRIGESSQRIQDAIENTLVRNGHAVRLRHT